jgi:ribosomal-protein-alanine N-acetyltransferase
VGDKLVGFTLGEALSPTQASILIEKTDPDYDGAAQFIFSEFCRQYWAEYPECNAGDDWGIPSLRFTKESYRPTRLLSKYILTRQVPVVTGAPAIDVPIENPAHSVASGVVATADAGQPTAAAGDVWSPSLRAARVEDVAAILELESVCFTTLEETFNRRQVRYLIASQRATVTVAENQGRIIGWSVGLVRQHRRSRSGRLYAVAVHPQAQGRRLGRALVEHTLEALATMGIERIYLEVRGDNEAAIHLYKKMGFADHRHLPNYYGQGRHGRSMKLGIITVASDSLFAGIALDEAVESIGSLAEKAPRPAAV